MPTNADELRHLDAAVEAWWWWAWNRDATVGLFVGFELRGLRFDYWAGLARVGETYLYVEELDGTGLRQGLEIKPPEMWADQTCEVPYRQWNLGNEAHAVLLDDPMDAMKRPFGSLTTVAFDIEWYATGEPVAIANGYEQAGEVNAVIELGASGLAFEGPAHRVHVWGAPHVPPPHAVNSAPGRLVAPYRRRDGTGVVQVLTERGWQARTVEAP